MMSGILDDFKFEHDIADNGKIAVALWISAPGQGDFELVPFAADAFTLKAVPGYNIQFDMKDNKPVGLSFTQPNGVFEASVKKYMGWLEHRGLRIVSRNHSGRLVHFCED